MDERYNAAEREKHWQKYWEENKIYSFDPKNTKKIYTIDTPPPTMSGRMHIGHAFSYSQQDFIARYKRMNGHNVFFPFGTDDNGLPTERMIEKMKNVKSSQMKRQEFITLCLQTLDELRPEFIADWKNLGISCDFNIIYSTIDEHCRKISQWSFIELFKKGRVYRKEAPVIWCPECQTAIAQAELQDKEKQTQFVHVEVKTSTGEKVVFATTRPELMMACIAISVHPDDKRYKHIVGKTATIPVSNAKVLIVADTLTDMEFGSGVVYWCPYGDAIDVEFVAKHPELKVKHILNKDGRLNQLAGQYAGLTVNQARKKVIEDWQKAGAIKKLEPHNHVANAHERCGTEIEFISSQQWFIKYLDIRNKLIEAGKKIDWHPEFMRLRYENWVKGLKWDWCISRQRYFGVPFPLWYCKKCGNVVLADEKQLPVDPLVDKPLKCSCGGKEFEPEKDVLDTWATSSLTPLIVARLFENMEKKLLPMSLRPQGHDIISTWLFYTTVKNVLHFGEVPWKHAAISGWVLDPLGKKMSKSKGNVIAPQEIMQKYSADALRFAAGTSKLGEDVAFQDKELVAGSKLITKLWNASKFVSIHLQNKKPKKLEVFDRWILSKLSEVVQISTKNFESYDYSKTRLEVEKFFMHTFCDNYLEIVKDRLYNKRDGVESAQYTLYTALLDVVKMMAPLMPHITEEVYQTYFREGKSVHLAEWPVAEKRDMEAEKVGDIAVDVISAVRKYKSQKGLSLKTEINELILQSEEKGFTKMIESVEADLKTVTRAKKITFGKDVSIICEKFKVEVGIK